MLRYWFLECPCSGGLSMTPNQGGLGHQVLRISRPLTPRISPRTIWVRFQKPKHLQFATLHPSTLVTSIEVGGSQPVGLGHRALKAFTICPSDLARVSRHVKCPLFFLFFSFFFFFFSYIFFREKCPNTTKVRLRVPSQQILKCRKWSSSSSYNRDLMCTVCGKLKVEWIGLNSKGISIIHQPQWA